MGIARELMEQDVERVKRSMHRLAAGMLCLACGVIAATMGGAYSFQMQFASGIAGM